MAIDGGIFPSHLSSPHPTKMSPFRWSPISLTLPLSIAINLFVCPPRTMGERAHRNAHLPTDKAIEFHVTQAFARSKHQIYLGSQTESKKCRSEFQLVNCVALPKTDKSLSLKPPHPLLYPFFLPLLPVVKFVSEVIGGDDIEEKDVF